MTDDEIKALVQGTVKSVTAEAVNAAIGETTKSLTDSIGELAKNQKIFADTYAADKNTASGESGGSKNATKPEPVTAESIGKIVADQIAAAQKSQQASDQSRQQREQFIANRLKNFPPAYQNQLGNDPAKFEEEARNIEQVFRTDATKFGWKAPSVGGENAGGQSPAAVKPDLSKLSASELIRMGVQQSKPGQQSASAAA